MSQKKDIIKDASVLGIPKMLLLGLQHMFAMFGATILVPMLVNSYFKSGNQVLSIQVTLFCARFRYSVFPFMFQTESSCFPWFILCIPGWIFKYRKSQIRYFCKYARFREIAICMRRYLCCRSSLSDSCTDH